MARQRDLRRPPGEEHRAVRRGQRKAEHAGRNHRGLRATSVCATRAISKPTSSDGQTRSASSKVSATCSFTSNTKSRGWDRTSHAASLRRSNSYQQSAISLSVRSDQQSADSYQFFAISSQQSAVSNQFSAISPQLSVSAISCSALTVEPFACMFNLRKREKAHAGLPKSECLGEGSQDGLGRVRGFCRPCHPSRVQSSQSDGQGGGVRSSEHCRGMWAKWRSTTSQVLPHRLKIWKRAQVHLLLARDLGFLPASDYERLATQVVEVKRMLCGFIRTLDVIAERQRS